MLSIVTVPQAALDGIPSDASNASIKAGEQISVKDLLYCTMVRSANEAAAVTVTMVSRDNSPRLMASRVSRAVMTLVMLAG